jgi:seryl-tRNA synthetase
MEKLGLVLNEEAGTISGTRQVIYNDKAAKLVKGLERFMLDLHNEANYRMVEPPVIVNASALYNTGQLPKFEEDLFKLTNGQYLIPTAEVPLTNLSANKIYKEDELPIKLVASTPCFRQEAGSAGRDTRGIVRLHHFRKVELVKFGKASEEGKDFNEMLDQASKVLELLEIPYRHLLLCTGDMSFGSKKTMDIEV